MKQTVAKERSPPDNDFKSCVNLLFAMLGCTCLNGQRNITIRITGLAQLTHWGLGTLYGDRDLGQHWLRRHQAITWTNVDWSSVKFSDIHIRAISQEMPQPSITKIHLKITYLKFHSNFPGANELKNIYSQAHESKSTKFFTCKQNTHLSLYGQDILCGISKVPFEISHKISYTYIERCIFFLLTLNFKSS